MTMAHQLQFTTTWPCIAFSVGLMLLATGLSFYSWCRAGHGNVLGRQELLRLLIIGCVLVLLNQPEWILKYSPESKPVVAVLWDDSGSMQTEDQVMPYAAEPQVVPRSEAVQFFTNPAFWQPLTERLNVVLESFGNREDPPGSNLYEPLTQVAQRYENLLGIVLISDGDWNAGRPPVEAATQLRRMGLPVFTLLAGSPRPLPDLNLLQLDPPTSGNVGKTVRIPFTIHNSLPEAFATTVTLTTSAGETLQRDLVLAARGTTSDAFLWTPPAEGDFTLSVTVPRHEDERLADNNHRQASIRIHREQLRVLLVESYSRWEYRYLRNALSRDPGIDVACLLYHPGLEAPGGGSSDYIKEFPASIEALARYDVVFLGDVGLEPGQLTVEDCQRIRGLVEQQAGGLIFMPGLRGRQASLIESTLSDLYPVVLDSSQPGGWGSRTPATLHLTDSGRRSLLTKLADTNDQNAQVWENLPGFQWHAAVQRAKAGTETLAVHSEMSNEFGRLPLLVTKPQGAGKVLFMGTDGAWRWRKGVEDLYHYRFWGQVIRWMAYQRNMARGETLRLVFTPEQPEIGQTLSLQAHVMNQSGEPLNQADVQATITTPGGTTKTLRMRAETGEWGTYQGQFQAEMAGKHRLLLACTQTEATLETSFLVQGQPREQTGKPARPEVLEEISRLTNAATIPLQSENSSLILDQLRKLPLPPPSTKRLQLWNHPLVAAVLGGLLVLFWVWRKASGLT